MAKKEDKAVDLLLQNTIELQKTLVNLASEVKTLNKKVDSLLKLFETASSSFREAKSKGISQGNVPGELLDKIDTLVEQNKTLAKGLLLLEKTMREKETMPETTRAEMKAAIERPMERPFESRHSPLKKLKQRQKEEEETSDEEEYKPQPLPEFSF